MKKLTWLFFSVSLAFVWVLTSPPAKADSSHARIVRLSLVQGDVRFTQEFHKDSLDDAKAVWEVAPLNLPIRQGYAVATDANGRAEVEFENGAMAFLSANSLLEFYDLSLEDGDHITRLILRQGSAIFYVHPAGGDYFSVTGGDFSVEANGRSRFRMDNFDDGSNVNVEQGNVNVLRKKGTTPLTKGQSYSININAGDAPVIARAADADDFDKWVSGRIDNVATSTAYSNQYVNSPDYSAGFADLYNYGSFYNMPGYGYCWQPFGVGLGWSPFGYGYGNWYFDSFLGWNFIGAAPWGWLPYHYGGWIFAPGMGWMWAPTGFGYGGPVYYRPITAVWVHSGATTGLVPVHPADAHGRTPVNLSHGVYALQGNTLAATTTTTAGEKWSVAKNPPRNALASTSFVASAQPTRVSRTILSSNAGSRSATFGRNSSIVYDAGQHRYVNSATSVKTPSEVANASATAATKTNTRTGTNATVVPGGPSRPANVNAGTHGNVAPARPHINPPAPSYGGSAHSSARGTWSGSSHGSTGSSMGSMGSVHSSSTGSVGHASGGGTGGGHH